MNIPFNNPPHTGKEEQYVLSAIHGHRLAGDGNYTQRCHGWFERQLPAQRVLMTPSCTSALEMAAILADIQAGDEVIMPSFTFVSTANAFVLRGARIVFVDVCPDTMNIDASKIEAAVTDKTRAIVPVHYAGVGCNMEAILSVAERYGLVVIEDAAQGILSSYKGQSLGSIGHLGTLSFHETKNISSGGEGGLLIVNDSRFIERAEIIREKGTNRSQFIRGEVDKYSWVDVGGSHLASDLQAAYLWAQLEGAEEITQYRLAVWQRYYDGLLALANSGKLRLPRVPPSCQHNGHIFYLKAHSLSERETLRQYLATQGIQATFHYTPLHSSLAGQRYGSFSGYDLYTTSGSECLLRLPLWYGITFEEVDRVIEQVELFYR